MIVLTRLGLLIALVAGVANAQVLVEIEGQVDSELVQQQDGNRRLLTRVETSTMLRGERELGWFKDLFKKKKKKKKSSSSDDSDSTDTGSSNDSSNSDDSSNGVQIEYADTGYEFCDTLNNVWTLTNNGRGSNGDLSGTRASWSNSAYSCNSYASSGDTEYNFKIVSGSAGTIIVGVDDAPRTSYPNNYCLVSNGKVYEKSSLVSETDFSYSNGDTVSVRLANDMISYKINGEMAYSTSVESGNYYFGVDYYLGSGEVEVKLAYDRLFEDTDDWGFLASSKSAGVGTRTGTNAAWRSAYSAVSYSPSSNNEFSFTVDAGGAGTILICASDSNTRLTTNPQLGACYKSNSGGAIYQSGSKLDVDVPSWGTGDTVNIRLEGNYAKFYLNGASVYDVPLTSTTSYYIALSAYKTDTQITYNKV